MLPMLNPDQLEKMLSAAPVAPVALGASVPDDDSDAYALDSSAVIARALVRSSYKVDFRFVQAQIWLGWALGHDEAAIIVQACLEHKIRQAPVSRSLVQALYALASEKMKMQTIISPKNEK
jgi:hypothetical protein